jgi:chromosome segregation ATPase
MEMFVHETSRAQEAQRGHLRDDSMFLPPASPPQGGHANPQTFASGDPVLAAKLKERTNQVASLKKQISDLEDTIRQGKQLLADAASREGAHSKAIEDLRASWQLEWNDHEAKLKEEYELRELQREKASADERVAVLNAQLLIVHDDRAREERGHQAEQKERKRLEKEVETLNWDIHNLEVALKRERERVALRPNEQSLKDWNELLNSLLKQVNSHPSSHLHTVIVMTHSVCSINV